MKNKRAFIAVLIVFLLIIMNLFSYYVFPKFKNVEEREDYDPDAYSLIALNIIDGNGFSIDGINLNFQRPPLYPLFLAAVFLVFGKSIFAVQFFQSIILITTGVFFYLISLRIFKKKISLVVALSFTLYPFSIWYVSHIWSEILFTCFLTIFIWCLIKFFEVPNIKNSILSGFTLGLTMLTKATTQLFFLFVLFGIIVIFWNNKKNYKYFAFIFLIMIVTISPWTIRNYVASKEIIPVATGVGSYLYANRSSDMSWEAKDESKNFKRAINDIVLSPKAYLFKTIEKTHDFWFNLKFQSNFPMYVLVGPILLLGLLGLFLLLKNGKLSIPLFFLILIILYFQGVHSLTHAQARYSYPIMPYVLIFSWIGVFELIKFKYPKIVKKTYTKNK